MGPLTPRASGRARAPAVADVLAVGPALEGFPADIAQGAGEQKRIISLQAARSRGTTRWASSYCCWGGTGAGRLRGGEIAHATWPILLLLLAQSLRTTPRLVSSTVRAQMKQTKTSPRR